MISDFSNPKISNPKTLNQAGPIDNTDVGRRPKADDSNCHSNINKPFVISEAYFGGNKDNISSNINKPSVTRRDYFISYKNNEDITKDINFAKLAGSLNMVHEDKKFILLNLLYNLIEDHYLLC